MFKVIVVYDTTPLVTVIWSHNSGSPGNTGMVQGKQIKRSTHENEVQLSIC